jgi:hypothetical protein
VDRLGLTVFKDPRPTRAIAPPPDPMDWVREVEDGRPLVELTYAQVEAALAETSERGFKVRKS